MKSSAIQSRRIVPGHHFRCLFFFMVIQFRAIYAINNDLPIIDVKNSGADVPLAIMVAPATSSFKLRSII